MPTRTVYLPDNEVAVWDAAMAIAQRRKSSISKVVISQLRSFVNTDNDGTGLPIGFKIPASMKDPVLLERERIADDFRAQMMEILEQSAERLSKAAES